MIRQKEDLTGGETGPKLQVPADRPEDDLGWKAETAERPGMGSALGWGCSEERRSYPLTGRRSMQQIHVVVQ
jgi:hypothetical protein